MVNSILHHSYSKMFLVHIFSSVCVVSGMYMWTQVLKRKLSSMHALVLLSLLPLISMLRFGTYQSGDLTFQAYKLFSFYNNLINWKLIPRWSAELNGTFGYPNFIFTYHTPYYIASLFHAFGFHLVNSVKLTLGVTYILSGVFFYIWLRNHVSDKAALIGALLYQYAPYRFVTMHFRATLGESTAQMMLPLCTLCLYHFNVKKTYLSEIIATVSIALLILTHQAITLLGIPLLVVYNLYLWKSQSRKVTLWRTLRPFFSAALLTTYYWLPILAESQFTLQFLYPPKIQQAQLISFFYSGWKYGLLFQGPHGELSPSLGYVHWAGIGIALVNIIRGLGSKFLKYTFILFCCYFLAAQSFSPTWTLFPILQKIQFSYRFVGILILFSSLIGAVTYDVYEKNTSMRKYGIPVVIFFLVITSIFNWGNRRTVPYSSHTDFIAFTPYITEKGEGFDPAIPRWVDPNNPWKKEVPKHYLQGIDYPVTIKKESRKYLSHSYYVHAVEQTRVVENTYYFPGWILRIDNKSVPITVNSNDFPELITFIVPKGNHHVSLEFTDTPLRRRAYIISCAAVIFLLLPLLRIRTQAS